MHVIPYRSRYTRLCVRLRLWASPFTLYPYTGQHGRGPCGGLYAAGLVVKLVPYYAWANRELGQMNVWLRS